MSFQEVIVADLAILEMAGNVTPEYAKGLAIKLDQLNQNIHVKKIVLNFKGQFQIEKRSFVLIGPATHESKRKGKQIFLFNCNAEFKQLLKEQAVQELLRPIDSLVDTAIDFSQEGRPKLFEVGFFNPFSEAVLHTLKIQAGLTVTAKEPVLKEIFKLPTKSSKTENPQIEIAAVVGMQGKNFQGSTVLAFPKLVFDQILRGLFQGDLATEGVRIEEAAGELLNIIYGHAKRILNSKGMEFTAAIPTIITGEKLDISFSNKSTVVIIPFESSMGSFRLEIGADSGRSGSQTDSSGSHGLKKKVA